MKKLKIISFILLLTFIFAGCSNKTDEYLVKINYKEFKEKIENKETFFVEIVQDGCSYCEAFTPKLREVLMENKVIGYQINITKLTEEEYNEFSLQYGKDGTPTTIFLTEGKEISKMQRISGNVSKTKIVSKLKGNGYIKR